MKNLLNNIIVILIIIGLTIFIQHKYFPNIIDNSTHTSDTIWKDSTHIEYYPKYYPVYRDTGSVKIVELPADSAAITKAYLELHKDFYSTYFYNDTLKNDSLAFIAIQSKITQNRPIKYTLDYINRTPSIINNTTNIYTQNEIYLGLDIGTKEFSTNLLYKSKKGYIFGVGYDPINNSIQAKGYINVNKILKK